MKKPDKNIVNERMIAFFDEMNILKTEKSERVKTAKVFFDELFLFYIDLFNDILNGLFLHENPDEFYLNKLFDIYLGVVEKTRKNILYDSDVVAKAIQVANYIHNTNRTIIYDSYPERIEYSNNIRLGIKNKEEQIPVGVLSAINPEYNDYRVFETSLNESLWIHNNIRHKEKIQEGQLTHTWETMKDERVREAHAAVDGQTKPINEPFIVDGYEMMYPGDTLTSNPPGELVILCRCIEI